MCYIRMSHQVHKQSKEESFDFCILIYIAGSKIKYQLFENAYTSNLSKFHVQSALLLENVTFLIGVNALIFEMDAGRHPKRTTALREASILDYMLSHK